MKAIAIILYLLSITLANVVTAALAPFAIGIFIIPAGTVLIGATFILRDFVQRAIGRKKTYYTIAAALILSALTSYILGDTLWIVFASAVTFLFSESADTEIYTRLKLPFANRVFYSGIIGSVLDSVLFILLGLSPLGAGFLPWEAVPAAILGQMSVKIIMQTVGALLIGLVLRRQIRIF